MTVVTSRAAAAIDALVALATAALTDTAVVDGPFRESDTETAMNTKRLFIGCDDADPTVESTAAEGEQAFRNLGARLRDEKFELHCVAEGWDGNGVMKAARDSANAVLAGVELILRPTPTQLTAETISSTVMYAGIGRFVMTQAQTSRGAYCRISFAVAARANLSQ